MADISDKYRFPNREEKQLGPELVGKKVAIYWDGDKVYYPATLTSYNENTQKFCVEYEEDSTNEKYDEDLKSSGWKIWGGTEAEYAAERANKREALARGAKTDAVEKLAQGNQPAASGSSSSSRMSYTSMVIEAVEKLADRYGSSIQAVRKYLTNNFPLKQQQTASFNSLTLKALSKAVALEVLEYDKRLYRISTKEKERRKEKDKALRAAASAASRDALATRYKKGTSSNGRGSSTMSTDMLGVEAGDPLLLSFYGTAAAYNKSLRKELINVRTKRDRFLQARMKILKPFLIDKNYFFRKDRLEIERRKEKEAKRLELKQLATKQQAAIAASNIYATAYTSTPAVGTYAAQNGLVAAQSASSCAGVPARVPAGAYVPGYGYPPLGYSVPGAPPAYYPNLPMQSANGDVGLPIDAQLGQQNHGVSAAGYPPMPAYHTAVPQVHHTLPMVDTVSSGSSSVPVLVPVLVAQVTDAVTASVQQADSEEVPAEDEDEEVAEPEIDEKQLVYSTMEGVKLLPQPHILKAELHEHQIQGISWMVHMFQNGMPMILGDQMGLGKTIQSIGFMACLQQHLNKKGPFLVVVPLSVLSNWISEIERFCPSFRAVRFHGPKNERTRIKEEELSDLSEFDIVVTTYEILVSEINFFRRKYVWTAVIVDEGHRLKNEKSQFSEKLRLIACLSKVILSGTPLQNNLKELWAMLYYLAPDVFQSSKPFEEGFDLTRGHIDSVVLRKARKLLSVFMLRRLKEHVAIKLPSRRELTLLVPLTKQQHELYKQYLCSLDSSTLEVVMREETPAARSNAQSTNNLLAAGDTIMTTITAVSNGHSTAASSSCAALTDLVPVSAPISGAAADSDWRKLMNLLLQLRKICNHTYLLPDIAPDPYEVNEDIVGGSGKLMMLDRMLPMLRRNGHRVLIFSQFTSMLDLLEDYCELRDYPFVRLDGETNRVKRRLDVRRFNAPRSPLFIFLISTRAGGLGLNLASADTVILYDSDWNPQVDLQAMERAHRIGQVKPVRVYRLVCRGSVEERMVSRAEKKLFLNAMVAEADPDEQLHEADGAEEQSEDARHQAEISEALGIGGTAISKGELASLIRFGANAVFEGSVDNNQNDGGSGNQISDEELDTLLEMQGRDIPRAPKAIEAGSSYVGSATAASSSSSVAAPVVNAVDDLDDLAKAQQALRDRMQMLKEVDLRQLGSTIYDKKKRKSTAKGEAADLDSSAIIPGILDTKRIRKERVVMVDGKGTGYGGAVPVLAETMEKEVVVHDDPDGLKFRSRGRQWSHQSFCCMCGKCAEVPTPPPVVAEAAAGIDAKKIKKEDTKTGKLSRVSSAVDLAVVPAPDNSTAPVKCAHCPFIFHLACCNGPPPPPPTAEELKAAGNKRKVEAPLTRPAGMFICAHHRCCTCNRSTASAGGLLFRCTGCMTAYCEDCLPQDEIDSVGRCRPLEKLGYNSKQSYYIRCPYCCQLDGFKPTGILNDNEEAVAQAKKQDQRDVSALSRGQSRTSLTGNRSMVSLTSMGGDRDGASDDGAGEDEIMEGAEEAQVAEPEPAEEPIVPLKTQLMRLHWAEVRDPTPEPSPIKKKKGKKGKKGKGKKSTKAASASSSSSSKHKPSEESASGSDSEEEEPDAPEPVDSLSDAAAMWREWASPSATSSAALSKSKKGKADAGKVPEVCPADKAMQILLEHPLWLALRQVRLVAGQISSAAEAADGDLQMFAHVFNKIESGRYRSSALLVNDVRFAIDNNITKKVRSKLTKDSERTKFAELQALFATFLDVEFAMNVVV